MSPAKGLLLCLSITLHLFKLGFGLLSTGNRGVFSRLQEMSLLHIWQHHLLEQHPNYKITISAASSFNKKNEWNINEKKTYYISSQEWNTFKNFGAKSRYLTPE